MRDVIAGISALDAAILQQMMAQMFTGTVPAQVEKLADREMQVLSLAAKGHINIAIGMQLAQLKLTADPQTQAALEGIQTLTKESIQDLRRVIRALGPLYLEDLGLVASLQMLARETAEIAGLPIDFTYSGVEERLSPKTELAYYRIAQESLSNIQRHAKASKASLSIAYDSDQIQLTITDDCRSFDVPESLVEFATNGHFGLLGI